MSLRLSGINPLSYMGVEPSQPPNMLVKSSDPTANDFQNINVGTFWLVYPDERLWILISVVGGTATWVQLYPAGGGGGGASQFPCNSGIANEVGGVLNILGDGNVLTTGAGNTVTISVAGDFIENIQTDSGTAHPSSNTIRILGGTNINTSGSGNTITVNLDNNVGISGTLGVGGTTTLDGDLLITTQPDGVLQTNGSGLVSATNGTNGQLLIGGGTAPVWNNLTSTGGTVIITNGANTINLESTGGGGGGGAGSIAFYAYQPTVYQVPNPGFSPGSNLSPYSIGSGVALTTTINEGAAFYVGDGAGTPASFTAPIKGIYFIQLTVNLLQGFIGSGSNFIQRCGSNIVTPTLTYLGNPGQPTGSLLSTPGGWTGNSGTVCSGACFDLCVTVSLDMGDVVTFITLGPSSGGPSTGYIYAVGGLQTPISPGPAMPSTAIQGFLLKEL